MALMGPMLGKIKNRLAFKGSDVFVEPECSLGLEFEFEKVKNISRQMKESQYWAVKTDGSLHDNGAEFIFRTPMYGEDAHAAIIEMLKEAEENKYASSVRTGIHVHVDVRDISNLQLTGMIAFYCLFEPALYRWVGDDREFNNFCIPFYRACGSLNQAANILAITHENVDMVGRQAEAFDRYTGLNLKSLAQFGSVEFRQLRTTTEYGRIMTWINMILSMKRAAAIVQESTRFALLGNVFTHGPRVICEQVFGRLAPLLMNYDDFQTDVLKYGFPSAHHFLSQVDKAALKEADEELMHPDVWDLPKPLDANSHHGIRQWVEVNFPKDEHPTVEKPPPLKKQEKQRPAPLEIDPNMWARLEQRQNVANWGADFNEVGVIE